MTYLALGDSYTIGEAVPLYENFPMQLVQELRKSGVPAAAPEILARTGWTTNELISAMDQYIFAGPYDLVTLLIGVNNEYRGRTTENFLSEFDVLVNRAVRLCRKGKNGLVVLSIPDYSVIPFARDLNRESIRTRIDAFNAGCKAYCNTHNIRFLDITETTRGFSTDNDFLAADALHYSAKTYLHWAKMLSEIIPHEQP